MMYKYYVTAVSLKDGWFGPKFGICGRVISLDRPIETEDDIALVVDMLSVEPDAPKPRDITILDWKKLQ